jgi:hypothetical protein
MSSSEGDAAVRELRSMLGDVVVEDIVAARTVSVGHK